MTTNPVIGVRPAGLVALHARSVLQALAMKLIVFTSILTVVIPCLRAGQPSYPLSVRVENIIKKAVPALSPGSVDQGRNDFHLPVMMRPFAADDLDIIVSNASTPYQRGAAYERLIKADFESIAPKLMALRSTHGILSGIGPRTNEPWFEQHLVPGDRIGCTLEQLWSSHPRNGGDGTEISLLLRLLDDPNAGNSRAIVLNELKAILHNGGDYAPKSLPPLGNILEKLDALVRDQSSPKYVRRQVLEILFEHGDPNKYLDLAISLSDEGSATRQAQDFRFSTPVYQPSRFTAENRGKYLRHCYSLLERIDDGSGGGYFLASHIGTFLGIEPVPHGNGAFTPDPHLPQYQGAYGLKPSFFQETVENAKQWWKDHKAEYQ